MTFDYNWGSLVGTQPLVLIKEITNPTFARKSLEIICGKTRLENPDAIVFVEER